MAKKALTSISEDRSRFELRMPPRLKGELEALAEQAGVSLNSLVCAMLHGLVKHANVGFALTDGGYVVGTRDERQEGPEPIWFGLEGDRSVTEYGDVWFKVDLGGDAHGFREPMRVTERDIS